MQKDTIKIKRVKKERDGGILAQHKGADKPLFIIVFIIFFVQCCTLVVPFLWMFLSSLKEMNEFWRGDAFALPKEWLFSNYIRAFDALNTGDTTFVQLIFNSLWYTILSSGFACFMPCITGYVLSKYNFPGRDVIYAVAITALTLPIVGSSASAMKLVSEMQIYNSPLYVIVMGLGGFGGSFLVYYGFFKSVSWAYAEAAEIDGGGPYTIFFQIMLPQAVPVILTYFITSAIGYWNAYESIILWLPDYPTIAAGLFQYKENNARGDYPLYFAGLILSMIPTFTLFAIFSDKIMTSISVGGLKG